MHLRFWMTELPVRMRSWWARHWWPARLAQFERERMFWKDKAEVEHEVPDLWVGQFQLVQERLGWLLAGLDAHDPVHAEVRALLGWIERSDARENWRRARLDLPLRR